MTTSTEQTPKLSEPLRMCCEFFLELPPQMAKKAVDNIKTAPNLFGQRPKSLPDAINYGMIWQRTPEGQAYWAGVYRALSEHPTPSYATEMNKGPGNPEYIAAQQGYNDILPNQPAPNA